MASSDRKTSRGLEFRQALEREPYRFDFYRAMRSLECAHPDKPRFGQSRRASDDPVRLGQKASLAFAPSALSSFSLGDEENPARLAVSFFGLLGPNGPLPVHLTEYALGRIRDFDDETFVRFLDIFHHRMLTLFYRAWACAQPTVQLDRPETDKFSVYLGSLLGIGMPSLRDRDAMPDLAKLFYAGHMACSTRHPGGLQAILSDFFDLPVEITEFIGQWMALPGDCHFHLGDSPATGTLGETTTLGSHVWDAQQRFRISIGPIDWQDYQRFLPGAKSLDRLIAIVRNYVGDELEWEVNLILKREETPSMRLGEGEQLGLSNWLDVAGLKQDPRDLHLTPRSEVALAEQRVSPAK